jgi:apolipoprotein N-acyltransferase
VSPRSPGARARAAAVGTASVLSGVLVAFALPPQRLWFLAPVGLAGLAAIVARQTARGRFASGLFFGLGQFSIASVWAFQFTGWGYLVLVLFESLLVGIACLFVGASRGRMVGFVASMTLLEAIRDTFPFGGVPLGGIALTQSDGPLFGLARIGGPYLVVAAVALLGSGLAGIGVGVTDFALKERANRATLAAGIAATALVVVGASIASVAPDGGRTTRREFVAVVQGGGRRGVTSLEVPPTRAYSTTLPVLERIRGTPALVVTPEDALALLGPPNRSPRAERFAAIAERLRTTLLAGVTWPVGATRFRNELVVFGPSGALLASIEKVHPVPFGEYVPFRSFLAKIVSLAAVPRDVIVGDSDSVASTPAGRLVLLNSYEAFFPRIGRRGVEAGGELLVVETNTSSYGTSQVPAMELAASRLEAVAEGRTLVQSATTGYSAVVSPIGRVTHRSSLGKADLFTGSVGLRDGRTWYDDIGDLPVVDTALALLAISWLFDPRVAKVAVALFRRVRPR